MKNIIFDFDGTVIDSSECIFGIYKKLFAELGLKQPSANILRSFIGPPIEYVIKDYVDESKVEETAARFRELYKAEDLKSANKLYKGIPQLLEMLVLAGKRLFIATTKNENTAIKIAELLNVKKYFIGICGSRFDINRLTKYDVIDTLCNTFDIDKNDCIMIGDTHFDAEGASIANIPVAIVNYGFGDEEKLSKYKIVFRADTTEELGKKLLETV